MLASMLPVSERSKQKFAWRSRARNEPTSVKKRDCYTSLLVTLNKQKKYHHLLFEKYHHYPSARAGILHTAISHTMRSRLMYFISITPCQGPNACLRQASQFPYQNSF